MNNDCVCKEFIQLINYTLLNRDIPVGFGISDAEKLYEFSKNHEMTNLIAYAIARNNLVMDETLRKQFCQRYYKTLQYVSNLENELERIKATFERNEIDFIPLKGAVIRGFYLEDWMRFSSDIDIYIRRSDLDRAERILVDSYNFMVKKRFTYDEVLLSSSGIPTELHFMLSDDEEFEKTLFADIWKHCRRKSLNSHEYIMDSAYSYTYFVYHTAKHFRVGGCGVRSIIDTWLFNSSVGVDSESCKELLEKVNLLKFAKKLESIAQKWFSGNSIGSFDEVEEYILLGGIFGDKQYVAAELASQGGRTRFIMSRIFLPCKLMQNMYPILKVVPILLPFCWVHRFVKGMFSGKAPKAKYMIKKSKSDKNESKKIANMFSKLGLH